MTRGEEGAGHVKERRKSIAYFAVFAMAALLLTVWFSRGMGFAASLAAGEHGKDVFFAGGVEQYPQAAGYGWGLYVFSLALLAAGGYFVIRTKAKTETIFAAIAIPLGIIYLFMMVPMAGPDEQVHYQTSYQMSNALLLRWDKMNTGTAGHYDYHGLSGHYNPASGYERMVTEFFQPLSRTEEIQIPQYGLSWPIVYLPQAIGIAIGRMLGLNFLPLFCLGRLMNLLFYVFCVYRAIRIMPRYKLLLCMTALLPMCMHQAASFSYDTYINGLSFLLTAMILKAAWAPEETRAGESLIHGWKRRKWKGLREAWQTGIGAAGTLSKAETGTILLVALLWAPAKPVYTPLLLLLLIIPKERFGGTGKKLLWTGGMIGIVLAEALAIQLAAVQSVAASGMSAGDGVNWEGQKNFTLGWIIGHLPETAKLFLNTIRANGQSWIYESMGTYLAGLTVPLRPRYMQIYLILLIGCVLRRTKNATEDRSRASLAEEEFRTGIWPRILFIGAAVLSAGLVMLTMMLAWTSDTNEIIQGIQGRYFLPVFLMPFLCLDNRTVMLHRNPDRVILATGLCLHMLTVIGVVQATMMV